METVGEGVGGVNTVSEGQPISVLGQKPISHPTNGARGGFRGRGNFRGQGRGAGSRPPKSVNHISQLQEVRLADIQTGVNTEQGEDSDGPVVNSNRTVITSRAQLDGHGDASQGERIIHHGNQNRVVPLTDQNSPQRVSSIL